MADEQFKGKPKEKSSAPPPPTTQTQIEIIIGVLFILAIVAMILERLYNALMTGDLTFFGYPLDNLWQGFKAWIPTLRVISFALTGVMIFGMVVISQLRGTIWMQDNKAYYPDEPPPISGAGGEAKNPFADRWKMILEHVDSEHPSNWRLAIIEADIMLSELLDVLQLHGDTMGDKLKAVEKSDFLTIDEAWEGHKIRNRLAHEGSEFLLNQREARRGISLYQKVFEEFEMI